MREGRHIPSQSSHGFATRVLSVVTKTNALACEIPPATQAKHASKECVFKPTRFSLEGSLNICFFMCVWWFKEEICPSCHWSTLKAFLHCGQLFEGACGEFWEDLRIWSFFRFACVEVWQQSASSEAGNVHHSTDARCILDRTQVSQDFTDLG